MPLGQPNLDGPEALDWLRQSPSCAALAPRRFPGTAEAIAFVELLYAAGADRVVIPLLFIRDDPETIRETGGPQATALVVHLPDDPARREPLVWLCGWEQGSGQLQQGNSDVLTASVGRREVFLSWTSLPPPLPGPTPAWTFKPRSTP